MSLVTYKGTKFSYLNPTKEMIDVEDMIRSICRLNRFVGHSTRAYNVGEHTFNCLVMAEKLGYTYREQFHVFIHDFAESFVGDCPAPLKRLIPEFSRIEGLVEQAIYEYFEIPLPTEEEYIKVKRIDLTMLVLEMRDLTLHDWKNFVYEGTTYIEMLDDDEFNLKDSYIPEGMLNELLNELLENLLKKVKRGE